MPKLRRRIQAMLVVGFLLYSLFGMYKLAVFLVGILTTLSEAKGELAIVPSVIFLLMYLLVNLLGLISMMGQAIGEEDAVLPNLCRPLIKLMFFLEPYALTIVVHAFISVAIWWLQIDLALGDGAVYLSLLATALFMGFYGKRTVLADWSFPVVSDYAQELIARPSDRRDINRGIYELLIVLQVSLGTAKVAQYPLTGIWLALSNVTLEALITYAVIDAYRTQFGLDNGIFGFVRSLLRPKIAKAIVITVIGLFALIPTRYLFTPIALIGDRSIETPWHYFSSPLQLELAFQNEEGTWIKYTENSLPEIREFARQVRFATSKSEPAGDSHVFNPQVIVNVTNKNGNLVMTLDGQVADGPFVLQDQWLIPVTREMRELFTKIRAKGN